MSRQELKPDLEGTNDAGTLLAGSFLNSALASFHTYPRTSYTGNGIAPWAGLS